ncbi:MAG: cobalt ECF transporter T component CbiQ [Chloroflexota bacterium]
MSFHASTFDRYLAGDSAVHHLDPRVKVVVAVVFIVCITLLPDGAWWLYALSFALVMGATLAAEISPWLIIRRSLVGLPFLLAAVTVLFTIPGNSLWTGPFGLTITDAGAMRFGSIVLRSLISLQTAVLLTATTSFPDILHALRHLKVPDILVSVIAFMYRYLFVLTDEVSRLLRGRAARSAALPGTKSGGNLGWRASVAGNMAGQLMIRSLDRSDRVYQAMLARGYRGQMLTLKPHEMRPLDWTVLVTGCLIAVILPVIGRL